MIRLIRAELRKAVRPLVGAVALGLVLAAATFAWQQQAIANQQVGFVNSPLSTPEGIAKSAGQPQIPGCEQLGLSPGPQCDQVRARALQAYKIQIEAMTRQAAADRLSVRTAAVQQNPLGAGQMAAWLFASILGAIAVFLLAAGQFGGEWTGGTIATVLTQDSRRWRLLTAKLISLLVLTEGLLLLTWATLAALALLFQSQYPMPAGNQVSNADAIAVAAPVLARSVLVTAAFCVLGVLAAVITRNALGTLLLAIGSLIVWMMFVLIGPLVKISIGYWVTGWMGFTNDGFSSGQLWSGVPSGISEPTQLLGLVGLVALLVVGTTAATIRFQRMDIAG
jgi:ABC-type transport system involved in multi-copper enzyme maturation permease subunit